MWYSKAYLIIIRVLSFNLVIRNCQIAFEVNFPFLKIVKKKKMFFDYLWWKISLHRIWKNYTYLIYLRSVPLMIELFSSAKTKLIKSRNQKYVFIFSFQQNNIKLLFGQRSKSQLIIFAANSPFSLENIVNYFKFYTLAISFEDLLMNVINGKSVRYRQRFLVPFGLCILIFW